MLKEIFNSITPENLKKIPLMKDAMDIFIETLEEKCGVSADIKEIFRPDNTKAREEFIKIYLDDLNRYLTKAKTDVNITNKIERMNNVYGSEVIPRDFVGELSKLFNDEHFITSKAFKQKKGTKVGIEYIFNLVEGMIQGIQEESSFAFIEHDIPFYFTVEGSIYKEIYDGIVKPLAHPLGFTYVYLQIIKLSLQDYYQIERKYVNIEIEVRCLDGNITTFDGTTVTDIQESFDNGKYTKITFDDGSYLVQTTNPIHVVYYDIDDDIITDYAGHCSLYLYYDVEVTLLTTDKMYTEERKHIQDNYWADYDVSAVIGTIVIGDFFVGGYGKYHMNESLDFLSDSRPTYVNGTYSVQVPALGFKVGTTPIGTTSTYIGYGYETINTNTTEVYDVRNEVIDHLEINGIPEIDPSLYA